MSQFFHQWTPKTLHSQPPRGFFDVELARQPNHSIGTWTYTSPWSLSEANNPLCQYNEFEKMVGGEEKKYTFLASEQIYPIFVEKAFTDQECMSQALFQLDQKIHHIQPPSGFYDDAVVIWLADDPLSQYIAELEKIKADTKKIHQAYERRIEELRSFAADDDDCSDVRESSKADFWSFVQSMPRAKEAELVLLDNGNLRAVWEGDGDDHLGIQFLGDGLGEFVIFHRRENAKKISRVAGIDTLKGVKIQVCAFGITLLENG